MNRIHPPSFQLVLVGLALGLGSAPLCARLADNSPQETKEIGSGRWGEPTEKDRKAMADIKRSVEDQKRMAAEEKKQREARKPAEKEPAKKEPAKKEPVQKEPTRKEPVQKEPTRKEPAPKEPAKKEPKKP